ncbi:MAG: helix-turn-helix domain-containing protein [Candidatus Aenigmarchaeota archaeon]|nr:helix-turn-helix domain-containing protein [Candidatus Aenigmarchaeota archaeon]
MDRKIRVKAGWYIDIPGETSATTLIFENQLLNYKQAARYLSVSESYLRRLKGQGQIACVLVGSRAVRFRVSSLNRWIEKREMT